MRAARSPRGALWVPGLVGHFVQTWPDSECSYTVLSTIIYLYLHLQQPYCTLELLDFFQDVT